MRRARNTSRANEQQKIIDLSVEQLQRNFEMGPIAYLRTMQACYPHLKASGEGRVINFASLAAPAIGEPKGGLDRSASSAAANDVPCSVSIRDICGFFHTSARIGRWVRRYS
jgi:NAD(P)-dependent dehydrogenase (short-subunit alcohol dehydrogenase family)